MIDPDDWANRIGCAVCLSGLGVLLATGYWWPGMMFVAGATGLAHGLAAGHGWTSLHGSLFVIGLGIWFALGASVAMLLVAMGLVVLISALLVRPAPTGKPWVDHSLE